MSLSLSLRRYVSSDAISPSGPSPSRSRAQLVPGCRLHKAVMTTEHVNARGFTDDASMHAVSVNAVTKFTAFE